MREETCKQYEMRAMRKYEKREIYPEDFLNLATNLLSSSSLSYLGKGAVVDVVT